MAVWTAGKEIWDYTQGEAAPGIYRVKGASFNSKEEAEAWASSQKYWKSSTFWEGPLVALSDSPIWEEWDYLL